jgi:hypothetical protein
MVCDVMLCVQLMSHRIVDVCQPQIVEDYITDLLDQLSVLDEYQSFYDSLPVARRVSFAPTSSLVTYGSGRSLSDPIDLSQD